METRYYIHKSTWANFSSLSIVKGKSSKVVFTCDINSEEVLFGSRSWDTRIQVKSSGLFDTLQEALDEFRLILKGQLDDTLKEVSEVQKFLAGE